MDYSELLASNGSGDAALAHISAARLALATTITVDSTANWPAKFIATSGTLNAAGYIDPATKLEFKGHLSSGNIIIDSFEPGFTDVGNTQGQVVALRPSTGLMNELIALAQVAHNNDGTIKTSVLGALYPVGSVYVSTVATNPNTLFGFGTWVAFAAGQVLVGKAGSGTFNTAGASVGAETVNLAHSHTQNVHQHFRTSQVTSGPNQNHTHNGGNGTGNPTNGFNSTWNHSYERTDGNQNDQGMDSQLSATQSVVQPSIVVYMWNRTA
jgi:hypothetical protein